MSSDGQPGIVVLTHFASPYQLELFDEVARQYSGGFKVYYIHRTHPTRDWRGAQPNHDAHFIKDEPQALQMVREDFRMADLAVFNFYNEFPAPELLKIRATSGLPWCFWGERPGFAHPLLGRMARRWMLRTLHASEMPIWGIGRWAVQAYRHEFGPRRKYVNLPYFSDLHPYEQGEQGSPPPPITFLYSGGLSQRKGVDLLASAFVQLAAEHSQVRLKIMGQGSLEGAMRTTLEPCRDRVEFLGFKDWKELPAVYAEAHVLCVPSRHDGWGLVVPEGLASGLPVIGTDRTGAALEFLRHNENGWMTPAGDQAALLQAMRSAALLTAEEWRAMSLAARQSVAAHTLEKGAGRFIAACQGALADIKSGGQSR